VRGDFCCGDDGGGDGALLYGITLSRESGQDMERLLLLDAQERGLDAESCSMEKAAAVNASTTSVSVVSASVSAANLNGQACNKSLVSFNIQILVKIVRRLLVLVGPDEFAVLGEIVRRCKQLQTSLPGNLQLVSCHDADVFRSNTTSSEVLSFGYDSL